VILFLTLLHFLAMVVKINWTWSVAWYDIVDYFGKHRAAATMRFIAAETKPFYLPSVLIYWGTFRFTNDDPGPLWLNAIFIAVDLTMWLFFRNHNPDDDDRWKRRRKKVSESIKKVGARLVIVPVPTPTTN
jgi:hypothetical protein